MKKIGLIEIKQALKDSRFRDSLPIDFQEDIAQYLSNPNCTCNLNIYRKILKNCKEELQRYFPGKEILNEDDETAKLAQNNWTVINCSIFDLESELRKLPKGRKQMDIARYQDQVTVVINELDAIYSI